MPSPRAWHDKLNQVLHQFGFLPSKCDPSLFIHSRPGVQLFALVYVDDILITWSSKVLIHDLIQKLNTSFAFKHLGEPDYFLGLELKYLPMDQSYLLKISTLETYSTRLLWMIVKA